MIHVFCERKSEGAGELAKDLAKCGIGQRATSWPEETKKGDVILCWGTHKRHSVPKGVFVLNGNAPGPNKFDQLLAFTEMHLRTPRALKTLKNKEGWLPRTLGKELAHFDGGDLLQPPKNPDYWVEKQDFKFEYRLHVFPEKLGGPPAVGIRFGMKEPFKDDHHPWIRSYQAGWTLVHGAEVSADRTKEMDTAAIAAVASLGLDFGAVDLAVDGKGKVWVLEVNTAPGLSGMPVSIAAYREHLKKLLKTI